MKKASFKKDISKRENMKYDEVSDEYTCHNNRKLKPTGIKIRKSKSGYKSEATIYKCESCDSCEYKARYTRAAGNRTMQVSKLFVKKGKSH